MNEANCSGVDGVGTKACRSSCAITAGLRSAVPNSRFSRSTISRGRFAGPIRPIQFEMLNFVTPTSCIVGTSGSNGERRGSVVASARSLPSFT